VPHPEARKPQLVYQTVTSLQTANGITADATKKTAYAKSINRFNVDQTLSGISFFC
jgi:hypothetical protein